MTTSLAAGVGMWLAGCGKREPVSGFWNYPWGTSMDSVVADSSRIAGKLAEDGFAMLREPGRLRFRHVQFGLGYAEVRLDFDGQGRLWHGVARVAADAEQADSIRSAWRDHHGREKTPGHIDTDSGYTTYWFSGSTVDRHYFAPSAAMPPSSPVRTIDLFYGGCLSGCPLYSVRFSEEGRALFLGVREIEPMGGFAGRWPADGLDFFAVSAADPAFLTLENYYSPTEEMGLGSRGLRVHFADGGSVSAVSVRSSGPPALEQMLSALDSLAQEVRWDVPLVSWDTLDLRAQRWIDLDSLEHLAVRSSSEPTR